jgi:hypothetical protein
MNQQPVRDQIGLDLDALGFPDVGLVLPERIDGPWSNNLAPSGGAMDRLRFLERLIDDRGLQPSRISQENLSLDNKGLFPCKR